MTCAKQLLISVLVVLFFPACGGGGGNTPEPVSTVTAPSAAVSSAPVAAAGVSGNTTTTPVSTGTFNRNTPNNGRPFAFNKPGMRASVQAAVSGNPEEQTILHCTVTLRNGQECNLNTLPLLGMESASPDIDDIMSRLLVSHPWMATRFRNLLEVLPPEILLMTRGLTAIIISHDIRPSFYTPQTGAIYLDADGMWLTEIEKLDIDTAPDFRSSFGRELQYVMLWRYVKNNENVTRPASTGTRTLDDIKFRVAALLFHELAHANDYFSIARLASIDPSLPVPVAALGDISSSRLSNQFSLVSDLMFALARVSFFGSSASKAQMALTPEDIEAEFSADFASDYYNYSTTREDLAMAFEEAMMLYSFGIDRDVAITNRPGSNVCSDFHVTWGQRNRVADPAVAVRAMFAVTELLPEFADQVALLLYAQDPPTQMIVGNDWCQNQVLDVINSPTALRQVPDPLSVDWLIPYL